MIFSSGLCEHQGYIHTYGHETIIQQKLDKDLIAVKERNNKIRVKNRLIEMKQSEQKEKVRKVNNKTKVIYQEKKSSGKTVKNNKEVKPEKKPKEEPVKNKITHYETYEITAYTLNPSETGGKQPGDKGYGITKSGRHVREGVTIACPPQIKLGTWIYIKGIGKRRCDDTGSAVKGNVIDLYVKSRKDAFKFGRQQHKISILD